MDKDNMIAKLKYQNNVLAAEKEILERNLDRQVNKHNRLLVYFVGYTLLMLFITLGSVFHG